MTTLTTLLVDQPKLLTPYVDDMIPSLLKLTTYQPSLVNKNTTPLNLLLTGFCQVLKSAHANYLFFKIAFIDFNVPLQIARSSALKCLGMLTVLPIEVVSPKQTVVVRALRPSLDDHKRIVRKEAVDAVSKW